MASASKFSHLSRLSRHPATVDAVRVASSALGCPVEFVLLDPQRSLIVAAVGPAPLQPRSPKEAERQLLAGAAVGREGPTTAVAVEMASSQHPGALVAAAMLDEAGVDLLVRLARMLSCATSASDGGHPARADGIDSDAILAALRDVVLVMDAEFVIRWCNHAVATLLGWVADEVIGTPAGDLIHPEDLSVAMDASARLQAGYETYRVRLRLLASDHRWVPVSITGLDHSNNPDIGGLVLSVRNDDRDTEAERVLDRTQRVSSAILQSMTDAVVATDALGSITLVNAAARELFAIGPDTSVATISIDDLALLDEDGLRLAAAAHPLRAVGQPPADACVLTAEGLRRLSVTGNRVVGPSGEIGTVATLRDVTQARTDALELRRRALHDQLTGLPNRRHLQERLLSLVHERRTDVTAYFIDLDGFKNVNDIHGHRVGDVLLRATAERLRRQLRPDDILARHGGDEFVVVLVERSEHRSSLHFAERLRGALAEPYEIEGMRLHLTASVGLATQAWHTFDEDLLLQQADTALYAAKARGRDRVEVFDEELALATEVSQRYRNLVRTALDEDLLAMHFQPIVDADDDRIVGVEALARCHDSHGEILEPTLLLQAIDGTTLAVGFDHRGFELSCQAAATLQQARGHEAPWVSCNFSATSLLQPNLAERVMATVERCGASPHRICLEVTETSAFRADEAAIEALAALHRAGMRIALDDFGTGYSSLSHLRDLPLSTVKIDRSFINRLGAGGPERAIAAAVGEVAASLGFDVVAEGVETAAHLRAARALGFRKIQGWHYAPALPLDQLLHLLELGGGVLRPTTHYHPEVS